MENSKTTEKALTLNPYRIVVRPLTQIEALRAPAISFGTDLISYLDKYEKQRLAIQHDGMLSEEGRATAMQKLRDENTGPLVNFLTKAKMLATIFLNDLISIVGKNFKVPDTSSVVETLRQIEARDALSELTEAERTVIFVDEKTTDLLFYSILGAPLPIIADDILQNGVELRVKSVVPEAITYRNGAQEVIDNIFTSLTSAYHYLGLTAPYESPVQRAKFDLPDFPTILANLKPVTKG